VAMAANTFCVDSDVLIWHLRAGSRPQVSSHLQALAGRGAVMTTAISVAEVEQGVRSGEEDRTRRLLRALPVIAIDRDVAERAGELVRSLRSRGETLGLADALIASACLVHELTLVTLNVRHFAKVPGLLVEILP
jgi:predicted nucleic acid-binding protein